MSELQKIDLTRIEEGLSKKQQLCMRELCQELHDAGFRCHLVGGAVRDLLLQKKVKDLDFASSALPEQLCGIFPNTIPTGIKHGTITVRLRGESFEVTSYRSEGKYTDARRPDEIRFASSLSEDLSRRDFSINALAYDPLTGELVDEHGALADLKKKSICAIGNPEERFYEDGLRPVRACRFAAVLAFDIEPKTYLALCNSRIHERAAQVAIERFSEELWKGFAAQKVSRMIEVLEKSALLSVFVPLEQGRGRTEPERLQLLDRVYPAPAILRMAYWRYVLGFFSPALLREWAEHLRFSHRQTKDLIYYCYYFSFQKDIAEGQQKLEEALLSQDQELLYSIRKFLSKIKEVYGEQSLDFIQSSQAYFANSIPFQKLLEIYRRDPLVIRDLKIGGQDLLALGYKGAEVGKTLHKALEQVLREPGKNKKEILLESLK